MSPPPITCHILDTARGKPAANVTCSIYYLSSLDGQQNDGDGEYVIDSDIKPFGISKTNSDGRITEWVFDPALKTDSDSPVSIVDKNWETLKPGVYKIKFLTGTYFRRIALENEERGITSDGRTFFPFVEITFIVDNPPDKHYHVPLLLSNHSYTTYRGS